MARRGRRSRLPARSTAHRVEAVAHGRAARGGAGCACASTAIRRGARRSPRRPGSARCPEATQARAARCPSRSSAGGSPRWRERRGARRREVGRAHVERRAASSAAPASRIPQPRSGVQPPPAGRRADCLTIARIWPIWRSGFRWRTSAAAAATCGRRHRRARQVGVAVVAVEGGPAVRARRAGRVHRPGLDLRRPRREGAEDPRRTGAPRTRRRPPARSGCRAPDAAPAGGVGPKVARWSVASDAVTTSPTPWLTSGAVPVGCRMLAGVALLLDVVVGGGGHHHDLALVGVADRVDHRLGGRPALRRPRSSC